MKQSTWRGEGEEEEERGRFSLLPLSLSLSPVASPRYFFGALNERRPCSIGCNHLWREGSKVASWKEGLLTSWTAFRTGQKRTTRGFPFHYLSLSLSPFCLLFLLSSLSSFASSSSPFFSLLSPVSPVSTGDGCRVRIDDAWKSRFGRVSINRLRDE